MSVEEARLMILTRADDYAGWPDYLSEQAMVSRRALLEAIDRLILETQAEMPCYHAVVGEDDRRTLVCCCPSCRARAERKVPV